MLNNLSVREAVEVCLKIRNRLDLDSDLPLEEWRKEKDALAILANFALEELSKIDENKK